MSFLWKAVSGPMAVFFLWDSKNVDYSWHSLNHRQALQPSLDHRPVIVVPMDSVCHAAHTVQSRLHRLTTGY